MSITFASFRRGYQCPLQCWTLATSSTSKNHATFPLLVPDLQQLCTTETNALATKGCA